VFINYPDQKLTKFVQNESKFKIIDSDQILIRDHLISLKEVQIGIIDPVRRTGHEYLIYLTNEKT